MNLTELNRLAVTALPRLMDPGTQLFCHRVVKSTAGLVQEGVSQRYTAMALLGLHRWELAGGSSPVSISSVSRNLLVDRRWIDNPGDLGVALWLFAKIATATLQETFVSLQPGAFWERTHAARVPTMELAWFLTGLCYSAPQLHGDRLRLAKALATQACSRLLHNQGESGFFGHQSAGEILWSRLRGHIGSFADQVYPIYALSQYATTFDNRPALDAAQRCADAICQAQGALGQWWWHYDSASGKTFQRYPVYSVHQDGMAPMCLFAVGEATGRNYVSPILRGLSWIYGINELGCDMRDSLSGMIWRSIYSRGVGRRTREALDLVGISRQSTSDLRVLYECRPYHLGWLLYAFAGKD